MDPGEVGVGRCTSGSARSTGPTRRSTWRTRLRRGRERLGHPRRHAAQRPGGRQAGSSGRPVRRADQGRRRDVAGGRGSLRDVAFPGTDTARVLSTIAAPSTHVVTLTVTKKGYRRLARRQAGPGRPRPRRRPGRPGGRSCAAACRLPRPLTARPAPAGADPAGAARRRATSGWCAATTSPTTAPSSPPWWPRRWTTVPHGHLLREWIDSSVRFPGTMVDRIVPASTAADPGASPRRALGADRPGRGRRRAVSRSGSSRTTSAGPRPPGSAPGATLTGDAAPVGAAEAAHPQRRALGDRLPRGAAPARDDRRRAGRPRPRGAPALVAEDVAPTLRPAARRHLPAVRRRGAAPGSPTRRSGHRTVQVAMDGSQKLPQRLLGTVRDRLAQELGPRPRPPGRSVRG